MFGIYLFDQERFLFDLISYCSIFCLKITLNFAIVEKIGLQSLKTHVKLNEFQFADSSSVDNCYIFADQKKNMTYFFAFFDWHYKPSFYLKGPY